MYKKLMSSILIIILILCSLTPVTLTAGAANSGYKQSTYSGMVYKYYFDPISTGYSPATIIDYTGDSKTLYIPDALNYHKVDTIAAYAFENATTLETVTIAYGPDYIGISAFCGCSNLKYIELPASLTYLGGGAFQDCHALKSIEIPKGIDTILPYTFQNCESLQEVEIPVSVSVISNEAFYGCSSLEKVTIPSSVKRIDRLAFYQCNSLKSVTIPKSVTTIDSKAFGYFTDDNNNSIKVADFTIYGYKNTAAYTYAQENGFKFVDLDSPEYTLEFEVLEDGTAMITGYTGSYETLDIPSILRGYKVTAIGPNAFENCTLLNTVSIPETVTDIYAGAFNAPKLDRIYVDSDNPNYTYLDGVLVGNRFLDADGKIYSSENKDILIAYPALKYSATYAIPEEIVKIAPWAFYGNAYIKNITVHEKVIDIFENAFYNCSMLESITVSKSNEDYKSYDGVLIKSEEDGSILLSYPIGKWDTEYKVPEGVVEIAPNAFTYANNLESVTMADSLKSIGENAFYGCIYLENITLNRYLVNIHSNAFYGCDRLLYISIPASVSTFDEAGFGFDSYGNRIYGFTVFGSEGSASENYAANNKLNFINVDDNENTVKDTETGIAINSASNSFVIVNITDTEILEVIIKLIGQNETLRGIYTITNFGSSSPSQIKIPAYNENSKVYLIESDGTLRDMHAYFEEGNMVFITSSQGDFVLVDYELILGDANLNKTVNVKDATLIQKHIAKQVTLSGDAVITADVNCDLSTNITDATNIQKHIARIDTGYPIGEKIN